MSCGAWKDEASASKRTSRAYNFDGFGNVMQEKFVKFFTSWPDEAKIRRKLRRLRHSFSSGGGARFVIRPASGKHDFTPP
jgi:hypothetical protein